MRTRLLAAAGFVAGVALAASPALFGAEAPASNWSRMPLLKAHCRSTSMGPATMGQGGRQASLPRTGDRPMALAGFTVAGRAGDWPT